MDRHISLCRKIDKVSKKTYGNPTDPSPKECAPTEEVIALSPRGEVLCKNLSDKYRNRRKKLPLILKNALQYLYPANKITERPPRSKYDRSVRDLSFDFHHKRENSELFQSYEFKVRKDQAFSRRNSDLYVNCFRFNGQVESEFLGTKDGVTENKKLYEQMLKDSGLYAEIKIRYRKGEIKYRRMPV
ncbi:unnamed protein product [Blepharisma stoltei]|uniref:Uncharacterized protein n=1 Tax=Blepharisma stoltei TaxID=1481888 RepID=A0AAU9K729_9CILI|nr:unnamed protein product [Blepharisma stoltei]